MTIELSLVIAGLSVAVSIFLGITSNRRNQKNDDRQDASQMTTVIVGLESIKDLIKEVKIDMSNMKEDLKSEIESRIRMEEQVKSLWERIKALESTVKKG
jgi:restriction endonuclease